MVRDNVNEFYSNANSTPIEILQHDLSCSVFQGQITVSQGRHEFKAIVESDNLFLHENLNYKITNPTQYDADTPVTFSFTGQRPDLETWSKWPTFTAPRNQPVFSFGSAVTRMTGRRPISHVFSDQSVNTCFHDPAVCRMCATLLRAKEEISMARKVGQIIAPGDRRWLIQLYLGCDHETKKRKYTIEPFTVQRCRNILSSCFYKVSTNWHPLDWARASPS